MVFSDTSANQGILQECESILFNDNYGAITGNTSLVQTFTRYANRALDRVVSLIMDADSRWQWDDNNNTDYPIATTNIVLGQQDYSFATTQLNIFRVEVMDTNGNWNRMLPIDQSDIQIAVENFQGSQGTPIFYDKLASSIFLYPTPSYSQSASLKLWFQRAASYFSTADTTKEPGFSSLFHKLIPLYMSYDYAFSKQLPLQNSILAEINKLEDQMQDFYMLRQKDEHRTLLAFSRRTNWK